MSTRSLPRTPRHVATRLLVVASAALLAAPAAQAASAPTPDDGYRTLRIGATVRDSLTGDDQTLDDGSHVRSYALDLTEGQRVTLVLTSRQFEGVLMISLDENGAESFSGRSTAALRFAIMRADDDSDGTTEVRVTFTAPATGHYAVAVDGMDRSSLGAYQLGAMAASPATVARDGTPAPTAPAPRAARRVTIGHAA